MRNEDSLKNKDGHNNQKDIKSDYDLNLPIYGIHSALDIETLFPLFSKYQGVI